MIDTPREPGVPARCMLVVDDDASVRLVLHRFLRRHGWTVAEARSGEDALSMLEDARRCIDAMIVDLHLPGLPGAALCRQVAEVRPALAGRLVLASGDPVLAAAELRSMPPGCRVLLKPFELEELDAAVSGLATLDSAAEDALPR